MFFCLAPSLISRFGIYVSLNFHFSCSFARFFISLTFLFINFLTLCFGTREIDHLNDVEINQKWVLGPFDGCFGRKTRNYIVNNLIRKKNFSRESITLDRGSWIDGFLNSAFIDFFGGETNAKSLGPVFIISKRERPQELSIKKLLTRTTSNIYFDLDQPRSRNSGEKLEVAN